MLHGFAKKQTLLSEYLRAITAGLKWGWDINAECGVGAIPRDFKSLWADFNSVKVTEFGGLGHKALDCLGVAASLTCRPIVGAGAMSLGILGGITVPPLKVAGRVCYSLGEATVCGVGWPMLKMAWNGLSWAVTQVYQTTPPEENSIMVTWVPAAKSCNRRTEL